MPDHCERWMWRDPGEIIDRLLARSDAEERRRLKRLAEFEQQQPRLVSRETSATSTATPAPRIRLPLLKLPVKGKTTCRN